MDHSEGSYDAMASPVTSQRRRRLRRRRPASSSTTVGALLLAATALGGGVDGEDLPHQHQQPQHQPQHETHETTDNNTPLHRHLQQHTTSTLTAWRSLQNSDEEFDYTTLRPLDLVLDETDPTHSVVYQRGDGGFLEPYDFENYQVDYETINLADLGSGGSSGGSDTQSDAHGSGSDVHHKTSERIGLTNFDLNRGIGVEDEEGYEEEERDLRGADYNIIEEGRGGSVRNLRGGLMSSAQEDVGDEQPLDSFFVFTEENDPLELEEYEVVEDFFSFSSASDPQPTEEHFLEEERRLQSYYSRGHGKSSAQGFASSSSSQSSTNSQSNGGGLATFATSKPPAAVIKAIFPPSNTYIGARQTFGALVYGSMRNVCLQFKDHYNKRSDCFGLQNVSARSANGGSGRRNQGRGKGKGNGGRYKNQNKNNNNNGGRQQQEQNQVTSTDVWELSFEGFELFAGRRWQYRVRSLDSARNRKSTPWRTFTIDARAGLAGHDNTHTTAQQQATQPPPPPPTPPVQEQAEMLTQEILDENWPHGGIVQTSTGRILFFFEDHPYVCTGTVLQEPLSDRTIILTAGHCAYQYRDIGGRFARHALFIPNQVDTTGTKSNEICGDDPLGCWIPAFAVVNYEWTINSFPHSVPWDYAFYVIPNRNEVHESGFIHQNQPNLSKILEEIVEPMPVDFNWRIDGNPGEFTHGLGYSFNKDPAFRYCATNMSTKFGISTYRNLWLDTCKMTGGSSGGPWLKDTDTNGRGTVISVNSWGYSTSSGMAGPDFNTASGSGVECLFEVAKNTRFEDMVGQRGVVVDYC